MAVPSAFRCRSCGGERFQPVLSLGRTPLANALLPSTALTSPEPTFPLDVVFCDGCSLVQLTKAVDPSVLFSEYNYFSSFSEAAVEHARGLSERVLADRALGPQNLVVEIASNDGYLLQHYTGRNIPVLGIEPARNIAAAASAKGIETLNAFFTADLARQLAVDGRRADVIHANNVLAHVPDLNGFVEGIGRLLHEDGVSVIEVPWVGDLVRNLEFDTIYHEHLSYFSLTALVPLFERHGLVIYDVEAVAIHGGSLRLWIRHGRADRRGERVHAMLGREHQEGLDRADHYADFGDRVEQLRHQLRELLGKLKRAGHTIAAYGASAKGSTLLNCFSIGSDYLDFVVDRSTVKQGLYTPGTHLPIRPTDELLSRMPAYVLLLTWNFADEILRQQSEYRARGGRFILPVPSPRIL